jgi:general secretion pathway protein I
MSQFDLNKLITYMPQVIKNQWPKPGNGRPESSNQRTMINCSQPATRDQQQVTSIQTPVSSIQRPVSGFTLLEVLIAMAIMAIVLVSVYRLHSQTLSMVTANRFYTQAPMLAQSKMAQLEAAPSAMVSGDSGDFGEKFPGYSWSVSTEDVSSEALGEVAGDLKRIDVTVTLNENEYGYSIRSYRLIRE